MKELRTASNRSLSQRYRLLAAAYLSCIAALTAFFGIHNLHSRSDWAMGDWLINYSGGFVRRGLIGEVALLLGKAQVSPFIFVLVLQLGLYAFIFCTVWKLIENTRWELWVLALVFSPATLAYQVLDPQFGFRKEELFFASLSGLLFLILRHRTNGFLLCVYLTFCEIVCVLSHEGLAFFSLYLLAGLMIGLRSWSKAMSIFLIPAASAVGAVALVSHHKGSLWASQQICDSLGSSLSDPPTGLCAGAIAYLGRDKAYAHSEVLQAIHSFHYASLIPRLIVLGLFPVVLGIIVLWRRPTLRWELKVLCLTAIASFGASVPLFIYGSDWTRWIYIHLFSLFLLLMFIERRRQADPATASGPPRLPVTASMRATAILVFLAYVWSWDLAVYQPRVPFGGLVHYFYQQYRK